MRHNKVGTVEDTNIDIISDKSQRNRVDMNVKWHLLKLATSIVLLLGVIIIKVNINLHLVLEDKKEYRYVHTVKIYVQKYIKHQQTLHCKKKFRDFSVPSRDVTNQTLPGKELFNYSRPGKVCLVTSRVRPGKSLTFFYSVVISEHG